MAFNSVALVSLLLCFSTESLLLEIINQRLAGTPISPYCESKTDILKLSWLLSTLSYNPFIRNRWVYIYKLHAKSKSLATSKETRSSLTAEEHIKTSTEGHEYHRVLSSSHSSKLSRLFYNCSLLYWFPVMSAVGRTLPILPQLFSDLGMTSELLFPVGRQCDLILIRVYT